jgi:hypothetical protein
MLAVLQLQTVAAAANMAAHQLTVDAAATPCPCPTH